MFSENYCHVPSFQIESLEEEIRKVNQEKDSLQKEVSHEKIAFEDLTLEMEKKTKAFAEEKVEIFIRLNHIYHFDESFSIHHHKLT